MDRMDWQRNEERALRHTWPILTDHTHPHFHASSAHISQWTVTPRSLALESLSNQGSSAQIITVRNTHSTAALHVAASVSDCATWLIIDPVSAVIPPHGTKHFTVSDLHTESTLK